MPDPISIYLPNDVYKPYTSKPTLQQYDNYQVNTLICIDRQYNSIPQNTRPNLTTPDIPLSDWVAYEVTNPEGLIPINFGVFVELYP